MGPTSSAPLLQLLLIYPSTLPSSSYYYYYYYYYSTQFVILIKGREVVPLPFLAEFLNIFFINSQPHSNSISLSLSLSLVMKLNYNNRKLLQEQNYPFHPTLTYSPVPLINDSLSSAAEVRRPFNPNNSPFDTSMALTILILLTALFFMSFFSFYIRRYADDNTNNDDVHHQPRRMRRTSTDQLYSSSYNSQSAKGGLDPSTIQSLPTISYGGDAKHRMECSICLSEFEETETVKLIPHCRHAFHPPCIDTWLASHVSCPLCRSTKLFDEVRLSVVEDNDGDGVGEQSGRRSTVSDENGDEWRREVGPAVGVRRTCSYSSVRDRLSLPRSNSF